MKKGGKAVLAVVLGLLLAALFTACSGYKAGEFVKVYETTGTKSRLLSRGDDLKFGKYDSGSPNVSVTVNVKEKHQSVYGMGASMTHASAYLLSQADAVTRAEVLEDLFGVDGAGFNFVRVPVGTSDYTKGDFYTLCDLDDDFGEDTALTHFSVEKDAALISVLKEVVAINPGVRLIAVPWSAPAWMKSNHSLIGGSLEEKYNDVFADYIVKFVKAYADEGIPFRYVSLVNEPYIANVRYPSMNMDGDQAALITRALGPKLKAAKLESVKVMGYDHNYSTSEAIVTELYVDALLGDKDAAKYVSGIAFHGYGNDGFDDFVNGLEYINDNYGKYETYITEITEHDGSVDFASNLSYGLQNILINPINHGLSGAMYWNFVLTSDGQPVEGNSSVCFGVMSLDREEDGWIARKNASYYAMAHLQKFAPVVNGKAAVRVTCESSNAGKIIASALLRGDGACVVTVHNTDDVTSEDVDIVIGGKSVTYTIQPQSVVTFVC